MRIVLFTDTFPPTVNGVSRALGLLVEHGSRHGHQVGVVTPRSAGPDQHEVAFRLELPSVALPLYPELQASLPWTGRRISAALDRFDPHLVHCATEASVGWAGRRWARSRGIPLVSSYCTNFAEYAAGYGLGWSTPLIWSLLRRFHRASRITYCPSDATRRELRSRGFAGDLRLWPRGVDAELFHPGRRSSEVRRRLAPGAEVVLVYVGRLAPEKRVDLLLDAWPIIRARSTRRAALVLVGSGPARSALEADAGQDVHFPGYLHGEDLAAAYASSDVFVFPSDTETFGQVVTEAFASGLPAVVPARGGVLDLVRPEVTGLRFEPRDAQGLAAAVLRLVEDDALRARLGRNARQDAEERSWDGVFRRLFTSFEELLPGRDATVTKAYADGAAAPTTFVREGPE